ncbi:P-selectin glycoprotein ligand 1 [Oxyura jamaicensis]|uniref:P-selectin glycoprotein ligand 1 n=1 Tax=Oxyura jamaicensis TaxID=8884 RepID=UPI0015A6E738|nr:P-selectin glycoprotein ligand 1 [Oxyura jamaicensis]
MKPPALSGPRWQRDVLPPQGSPKPQPCFLPAPAGRCRRGAARDTPPVSPGTGAAGPLAVTATGAAARGPAASPGRGPMAPGWAVLVLLVLSTLRACGARPPEQRGLQWVWGAAEPAPAEPLLPSRRRRADNGQPLPGTATMPDSNETESLEPDSLLGSTLPPGLSTNSSLPQELTALPAELGETDSPEPDSLLLGTELPLEAGTNASLHRELVLTTVEPQDETDSPEPDLLLSSAPSTEAAPQNNGTAIPGWPMSSGGPGTEGTVAGGTNDISSTGTMAGSMDDISTGSMAGGMDDISTEPRSALSPTSSIYKKAGDLPVLNHPGEATTAPSDSKTRGNVVEEAPAIPWDDSVLMNKCLLAILLLALVAAAFMVCTGVLAALLCRRARTARHQLTPTEMVCISSLLPDGEPAAANGPRLGPHRHRKLLADGGSEADGDNLTLSSFLPDHS